MRQSASYGALHETHEQVDDLHTRLEPETRQPRNYEALRETQYEADRHPDPAPEAEPRQPGNYAALRETQYDVDAQRNSPPAAAPEPQRPELQRSWTHHGGMVPQQHSANIWIKQNHEIRMAQSGSSGPDRDGQGAQQSQQSGPQQNQADLQQARAAVEDARRREAAERARQHERDRSGPER